MKRNELTGRPPTFLFLSAISSSQPSSDTVWPAPSTPTNSPSSSDSPPSSDPDSSHNNEFSDDEEEEESFEGFLESVVQKWLHIQMTHTVSAAATDMFWETAVQCLPHLNGLMQTQKKIPTFGHLRKKMVDNVCPDITVNYTFKDKRDGSIVTVNKPATLNHNPNFERLYDVANVKV